MGKLKIENLPVQNFGSSEKSPQSFLPSQYLSNGKQIVPPLHGNSDILHDFTTSIAFKFNSTTTPTTSILHLIICK